LPNREKAGTLRRFQNLPEAAVFARDAADADLLFSTHNGVGLSLLRTRIAPGGTTSSNRF
jgi:hypothetical protein